MDKIDLRSDTVSWPTPAMRQAMAEAVVGDDVYGEDPTTNELERLAAEQTGKEAALFVASGTQGNLLAILSHCSGRGDEVILGHAAHIFKSTVGGASALGGVHPYPLTVQDDGTLDLDEVGSAIRTMNIHHPITKLVCIENTNGGTGGLPLTPEYTRSAREVCDQHGVKLHLDGARIWNAAAALDIDIRELTAPVDSLSFCLSKGLCAPIGAMLCGSQEMIDQSRHLRKMIGGGMRQVGIVAAAGIIAIEEMPQRLGEDHATARRLAEGLAEIEGINLDLSKVQTNMIFFSLDESLPIEPQTLYDRLDKKHNIRLGMRGGRNFRLITHYWISMEDVDTVIVAVREELEASR